MKQLAKDLILFAEKNKITEIGEVVETTYNNWKKPHKVKIYDIRGCLATIKGKVDITLDIEYYALRLDKYGNPKDKIGSGIVLKNLITKDGKEWKQENEPFNHAGTSFSIPNTVLEKLKKENKWWKSDWIN